jgi:hypothetical protein
MEAFVVSKAKLFSKLDDLEELLKNSVVDHLRLAIASHDDWVFCVAELCNTREEKRKVDKVTEELVLLGRQVLSLKEKLGESSQGSIAERICWYCREWNASDPHRQLLSSTYLAQQFLDEIEGA